MYTHRDFSSEFLELQLHSSRILLLLFPNNVEQNEQVSSRKNENNERSVVSWISFTRLTLKFTIYNLQRPYIKPKSILCVGGGRTCEAWTISSITNKSIHKIDWFQFYRFPSAVQTVTIYNLIKFGSLSVFLFLFGSFKCRFQSQR